MIFVSLIVIASSLAAIVSIEAAARGRLGINSLIGLRVSSVMSSDEAWQRGHAAARVPVWIGASGAVAGSLISIVLPESARGVGQTASTTILLLGVIVGGIIASRAARGVVPPVFDDLPPNDSHT
ncbi:SdpI family protein [Leifsonia shinshuensis]|uniref:SdpI family protein n=1 Tax=Leifsonia shinshuensis TaxID=150026 RepID=A0A7G6YFW3_9MICO|nr:SdpI family protein [Leifsonia shinshuensis]QNE37378.1 SdpI family protein [Leifsonia shinshuensis]